MGASQCIVFVCTDPAQPVPAASFALDERGDGHFGYGLRYLARSEAFALDPLHLPLSGDTQFIKRHKDGTYGVLSDAGPNAWGVRMTSSILRLRGGVQPATPVEWFLQS